MPTSKQRRDMARRRLERQLERRQEAARKRRQRNVVTAAALGVLVVVAGVWVVVARTGGNGQPAAAGTPTATPSAGATTPSTTPTPSATPTPPRPAKKTSGPCGYAESTTSLTNPYVKDVGLPPDPSPSPATGTVQITMATTRGPITLTLDRAAAPCAVQSFGYLAGKRFFDSSPCPRVTDQGIFVLQCGDPSGTSSGGATYAFKQENLTRADYSAGVVAMANSGQPNSTGSQFFIIYKDSNKTASSGLDKNYSVVGKVTAGLDVVTKVAASGNDKSFPAGGGKPKLSLTITTARVAQ